MNQIKKFIIIVIVIIIIIILSIIALMVKNKKEEAELDIIGDAGEDVIYDGKIKAVEDNMRFYTVENCINLYLNFISKNDTDYYDTENMVDGEEQIRQYIYDLLSEKYIKENNITPDNVYQFVYNTEEYIWFVPLQMNVLESINSESYVVYGFVQNTKNQLLEKMYFRVNLDLNNTTFSIEPLNQNYNSIDDINIEGTVDNIENKDDINIFMQQEISNEYIANKYIEYYKKIVLAAPEIAYNYFDEEYRDKRFGSLENYKQYVEKNKEEIQKIQCKKYLTDSTEDYWQYVCQDQYSNFYIFNEKKVMDFTMQLDTYTIPTQNFVETYQSSDSENKIMMNIDKWVQMLNCRDYNTAYKVLDETFKGNNFGEQEKFEQYMREKLPSHYSVKFTTSSGEQGGVYTQDIILTDLEGENDNNIQLSIIMQLKDDLDYVMSFSFQE